MTGHAPLEPADPRRIGPYGVLARLGAGGMGRVFLARGPDGAAVAVKLVHPALAQDPDFRSRFAREVRVGSRVRGPWTAAVLDADPAAETPWMATEYVPGVPLDRAARAASGLPAATVHVLAADLAAALYRIHREGLIHRDLKPANVLVTLERPVVIDFGIAKALDGTRLTGTGVSIGTPAFMSPEQIAGDEPGTASDLFSWGAVVVAAANGRGPFERGPSTQDSPLALMRRIRFDEPDLGELAEPVRSVVARCLSRDPADRPGPDIVANLLEPPPELPRHGWLPTPVIDLLPRAAVPALASSPVVADSSVSASETAETADVPEPAAAAEPATAAEAPGTRINTAGSGRWLSRRGLLVGAGVAALAAAGGGTWLLTRDSAPSLLWRTPPNGDLAPAVRATDDTLLVLGADGFLKALEAASGSTRWTYPLGADDQPPAVAHGAVYARTADYATVALDPATGRRRWAVEGLSPAGTAARSVMATELRPGERGLVALRPEDGARLWTASPPGLTDSTPIVTGVGEVVIGRRGQVAAYDLATGAPLWERADDTDALVLGGAPSTVLVSHQPSGGEAKVTALDPATGEPRWLRPAGDPLKLWVVVGGDAVYVVTSNQVACWDLRTGANRWATALGRAYASGRPAVSGRLLYVPSDAFTDDVPAEPLDRVLAFDTVTGELRWSLDLPPLPVATDPLLIFGELVVVSQLDGAVAAYGPVPQ